MVFLKWSTIMYYYIVPWMWKNVCERSEQKINQGRTPFQNLPTTLSNALNWQDLVRPATACQLGLLTNLLKTTNDVDHTLLASDTRWRAAWLTIASVVSFTIVVLIPHAKWFQEFHPICGVRPSPLSRHATHCSATEATARNSKDLITTR